jgi:hypothetical protein
MGELFKLLLFRWGQSKGQFFQHDFALGVKGNLNSYGCLSFLENTIPFISILSM